MHLFADCITGMSRYFRGYWITTINNQIKVAWKNSNVSQTFHFLVKLNLISTLAVMQHYKAQSI